ncbi:hypothetical protein ACQ4PT_017212 [Festuca glaucescens]
MAACADWSSLPSDLINRIADCLLATNDVDYYMDLRAVCGTWRSATADPKNNPDKRFYPSQWAVIDEVNYSPLDSKRRTRLLVNTATGRVLRKDLPMLRRYYVVTTTPGGFFVLADREPPHAACILNPFTGYLVRFMAPMVTDGVDAAAVYGHAAAPTLMLFCDSCRKLYMAETDSVSFDAYEDDKNTYPSRRLGVLGILYSGAEVSKKIFDLMLSFAVHPSEMLALSLFEPGHTNRCFLMESAGEMLMVMKLQHGMEVFKMDAHRGVFEPAKSIGNQAIFLGYRQCLSVNADKFPSIDANCIYYLKSLDPCDIYMYDLKDEKEERVSGGINTLNRLFLFDVEPPFTIIQLLSSYTINAWKSELQDEKMFEGLPDDVSGLSAYVEDLEFDGLSAYLEDLEFDD